MCILIVLKVWFRYVMNDPILGSDEAISLMLVGISYFGAVLGAAANAHIRVELLESWILNRSYKGFVCYRVCINLIVCVVLGIVAYFGVRIAGLTSTQVTDLLRINYYYVYGIIPVGLFFYITVVTIDTIELVRNGEKQTAQLEGGN
jgi:TRAP-type C4-dicarboxylate transport system permease small subunit